eukprot:NODE_451_length_993_cov_1460.794492_g287_i0.p1 GENE.NODE_451_length_993_cov_1460.794492_g287_i0~~NODE_451_length_993_cov_1460.794492_g287_i0.p1  ORF type:complete len:309 (-),score=73.78 NODE_451_length_993_cov_1460.794492_g287_i0:67-966(-)
MGNEDIFETLYFGALEASCELAAKDGKYSSFEGSPVSKGMLQFDMWGKVPKSNRWDWAGLRKQIALHGIRNSLLLAPMPTASTSQILGNNECFEPFTSNVYVRRVLSGEFPLVNKHLVKDLIKLGMWSDEVRNLIIAHNGSVLQIDGIPQEVKERYRTVWEVKQKSLIDMAAARSAYIDQSASLNLFLPQPTSAQLTSMHFYGWKSGLKTGMYYLRTQPARDAIAFTVDPKLKQSATVTNNNKLEKEVADKKGSWRRWKPRQIVCLAVLEAPDEHSDLVLPTKVCLMRGRVPSFFSCRF